MLQDSKVLQIRYDKKLYPIFILGNINVRVLKHTILYRLNVLVFLYPHRYEAPVPSINIGYNVLS
jgi:hypothetical protein